METFIHRLIDKHEFEWETMKKEINKEAKRIYKKLKREYYRESRSHSNRLVYLARQDSPNLWLMEQEAKEIELIKKEMRTRFAIDQLNRGSKDRETATKAFFKQERSNNISHIHLTQDGNEESMSIAMEYYSNLYNKKDINIEHKKRLANMLKSFSKEQIDLLNGEITTEEIRIAIDKCNQASSPGPDGLSFYLYKRYKNQLLPILTETFNKITEGIGNLNDCYEAKMILLYKR
jgi:hypothetical protein